MKRLVLPNIGPGESFSGGCPPGTWKLLCWANYLTKSEAGLHLCWKRAKVYALPRIKLCWTGRDRAISYLLDNPPKKDSPGPLML
jgi:hypothetical protein